MKVFYLNRVEDESGISGTGRVAQGFIFDNGKVAVTWLSEHPSVTVYDNTAASGTQIAVIDTAKALGTLEFDCPFNTGLTVVSASGAKVTVVYE